MINADNIRLYDGIATIVWSKLEFDTENGIAVKRLYINEYDHENGISLNECLTAIGYDGKGVATVTFEESNRGKIWQFGNHGQIWEVHGKTRGFW